MYGSRSSHGADLAIETVQAQVCLTVMQSMRPVIGDLPGPVF